MANEIRTRQFAILDHPENLIAVTEGVPFVPVEMIADGMVCGLAVGDDPQSNGFYVGPEIETELHDGYLHPEARPDFDTIDGNALWSLDGIVSADSRTPFGRHVGAGESCNALACVVPGGYRDRNPKNYSNVKGYRDGPNASHFQQVV